MDFETPSAKWKSKHFLGSPPYLWAPLRQSDKMIQEIITHPETFVTCVRPEKVSASYLPRCFVALTQAANDSFDAAQQDLGCEDRSCVIRKLCEGGDLEGAMAQYFTQAQITEIHNAATTCDPDAAN
ncbi:hypothetical protein MTO96_016543 [Rhipicephalus appendiculatus]